MVTLASLTNCECRQPPISRLTCAKLNVKQKHFHRSSKKFKRSPILSEDEFMRVPQTLTIKQQQIDQHTPFSREAFNIDTFNIEIETDYNNNNNIYNVKNNDHNDSLINFQQQAPNNKLSSSSSSCTTNHDPVYMEDDQVFYNLILKESSEQERRQLMALSRRVAISERTVFEEEDEMMMMMATKQEINVESDQVLSGQMRHSLLSWMLKVCEHQVCQDDIFPLACMILDKFLLFQQPVFVKEPPFEKINLIKDNDDDDDGVNHHHQQLIINNDLFDGETEFYCKEEEDELNQRQLYLFAACSLLLATKLRQTPRLSIQSLIEFSKFELPVELERGEIQSGEILILSTLKWDLASLVTPNDFLTIILGKCRKLLITGEQDNTTNINNNNKRKGSKAEVGVPSAKENDNGQRLAGQNHNTNNNNNNNINNNNNNDNNDTTNVSNGPRCDELKIRRHIQSLVELCLMDSHLSRFQPSILAMASIAVAIGGMNNAETKTEKTSWRLTNIITQIHEATHKINELKLMIDAAFEIEEYVQKMRDLMIEYSM